MLGFSAPGVGIGVASVLFESSGRVVGSGRAVEAASWARANGDQASARLMHRTIWRIPVRARIDDVLCRLPVTSNNRPPLLSAVALTTIIFPLCWPPPFSATLIPPPARSYRVKNQCAKRICRYIPSRFSLVSGVLAQLVERLNGIEEVRGSNPLGSTLKKCSRSLTTGASLSDALAGSVIP